jgi:16S rRNA (cytidine1402-2'-O)-methyltransferase
MTKGRLILIPNTLGGETIQSIIPEDVNHLTNSLRNFAVEEIKSARRLLRKMDRSFPIDECNFIQLDKHSSVETLNAIIGNLLKGHDFGIISEAGCPGIADPGAELVALAHENDIKVMPCVGPSSILLSLIGSGFSGQTFSFHGYLPKERKERIKKLKDFEGDTRRTGHTHIFMDTPFRNMHVLDDLLNELANQTYVCIASNLTTNTESIKTMSVEKWRDEAYDLSKIPVIFLIGKKQ